MVAATRSAGSRLIRLMALPPARRKPSSPATVRVDFRPCGRRPARKPWPKRRMKGPIAALALLSLALPRRSAERPSTSRRLTSLPSVAPTIAAGRGDDQHHLRLRVVPGRHRMDADLGEVADRGHRRRLGEDLGVRPDADLEILRPHALLDEQLLQRHRLRRAGLQPGEVVADQPADLGAHFRRVLGRAARLLLDHPLQHRHGEGDARRLDRLQVDRRQQPGLVRRASPAACWRGCRREARPVRRPRPAPAPLALTSPRRSARARTRCRRSRVPPTSTSRRRPPRSPCRGSRGPSPRW